MEQVAIIQSHGYARSTSARRPNRARRVANHVSNTRRRPRGMVRVAYRHPILLSIPVLVRCIPYTFPLTRRVDPAHRGSRPPSPIRLIASEQMTGNDQYGMDYGHRGPFGPSLRSQPILHVPEESL